jgi:hypothetical protein
MNPPSAVIDQLTSVYLTLVYAILITSNRGILLINISDQFLESTLTVYNKYCA